MNVQAHMSGQMSGQVPVQAGSQLPRIPQQNGNFHTHLQNIGGQNNPSVDSQLAKMRHIMQNKIYEYLSSKYPERTDIYCKKVQDIARRVDEGLFKSASSMEEYMNFDTLERRIHLLAKNQSQQHQASQLPQFVGNSTPVGTMIPTPGMQHNGNSNMTVSSEMDPSSFSSTRRLMTTFNGPNMRGGSFHASEGSLSNGYHQSPSSFPMNSKVNNMMATSQGVASQMIPTPGFSKSNDQTVMGIDNMSNDYGGVFSGTDSSVVQQLPQKHVGGQNSLMLQNLGSEMNNGMRSLMRQRFQDGSLNSGFGNHVQMVNGSGSSNNYFPPSSFGDSSRPLRNPIDQHQQPIMQGDVYRLGTVDSSSAGNLCNPAAPIGSFMNNYQNVNKLRAQSASRSNSMVSAQSSVQAFQPDSYGRPQLVEQVEKLNFQSSQFPRDDHSQSSMKQYQTHTHQMEEQQQFVAYQQHKQSSQMEQDFVRDGYVQSQMSSGLANHVKSEEGMKDQNEFPQAQVSSGQFQHYSNGNPPRNSQTASVPSGSQRMIPMHSQNPQPMIANEATNGYNSLPIEAQQEALMHGQWNSETHKSLMAGNLSNKPHIQEEFRQRTDGQDDAQRNNLSYGLSNSGQTVLPRSAVGNHGNAQREKQFKNQQKWLLFLRHARWCRALEGKCLGRYCSHAQKLLRHMDSCNASPCAYPRCYESRRLIHHHKHCTDPRCPVCVPVKNFVRQVKLIARSNSDSRLPGLVGGSCKLSEIVEVKAKKTAIMPTVTVENLENLQPSMKRLKADPPPLQFVRTESRSIFVPSTTDSSLGFHDVKSEEFEKIDNVLVKFEFADVKKESLAGSSANVSEVKSVNADPSSSYRVDGAPALDNISSMEKEENVEVEKEREQMKTEDVSQPSEHEAGTKSGKPKIKGVSITELFTPDQIREHIKGLRQWVGQSKAKAVRNQAMEHSMSENSCQLCAVERLAFEPPPIYCTPCGARIKRNVMYHTVGSGDTRHYICIPCYNEARGDTVVIEGNTISKSRLVKKKNDEETEESWVQCDKCEAWQHQVCALFNARRNNGDEAEYTCPFCYMEEVEKGERMPLPQSAVLGAKDLPRTILSDHIELRLAKRLRQERLERARVQSKSYDEVPGADGIVVRVVSSVDKKLDVKPQFLEIFRDENFPMEFPYKSKVVLLFQKIEGVEVCLFGMYVQEFGSECQHPNQRRVYLSYLDSVKYFRPDIKAVTGEALRTFVYHEILIGYLEYCKLRGFTSCYIWACPPLKGEDYILYCHPEIQKTPKSDKLREWYLAMLKKAAKENIVVELTNLYDHFFLQTGECRAKVTASRLPYFDGDYWPGAAEDMIHQINQEEEGRKLNKKGTTKKMITKRALKASGQFDLSGNVSKDLLLMHKLGETISPMKEDFIMVHLQHTCTHCCLLMVSGNRWVCNQCRKLQLCDTCYEVEQRRDDRERHPINQKDKHSFRRVEISGVPEDTKDTDEILESEFFDTRQAFLSLCQGNHYQYDTLRRAKHSSMMMLYHLHNPTAPAFVTPCNSCHLDIETGQGWRCETCPDFDVCNACYQKGGIDHPHKLTNHPSIADRDAQNTEARQLRVVQLRKMLDLLVHASQCRSKHCQYPNCQKVKGLFSHGLQCRVRASGGCVLCKKMWYLLQLHARACKESQCHVPRCRDLKEHLRRLQQQSDSRRRVAVMEMMRQRALEVAGNS